MSAVVHSKALVHSEYIVIGIAVRLLCRRRRQAVIVARPVDVHLVRIIGANAISPIEVGKSPRRARRDRCLRASQLAHRYPRAGIPLWLLERRPRKVIRALGRRIGLHCALRSVIAVAVHAPTF